jgi:hypothetical protein
MHFCKVLCSGHCCKSQAAAWHHGVMALMRPAVFNSMMRCALAATAKSHCKSEWCLCLLLSCRYHLFHAWSGLFDDKVQVRNTLSKVERAQCCVRHSLMNNITLHYMLHSKEEWEFQSRANERLIGGPTRGS